MKTMDAIADSRIITGKELFEMGDIGPCELIDGKITKMSPTGGEHGWLELNIGSRLREFVVAKKRGWVLCGEVGIYTKRDPDRIRGADIVFISRKRSPNRPQKGFLEVTPNLVVEIISPTDRWVDIRQRIEEYFSISSDCVWIVDPGNRSILSYKAPTDMQKFIIGDIISGNGDLKGFELDLTSAFDE